MQNRYFLFFTVDSSTCGLICEEASIRCLFKVKSDDKWKPLVRDDETKTFLSKFPIFLVTPPPGGIKSLGRVQ